MAHLSHQPLARGLRRLLRLGLALALAAGCDDGGGGSPLSVSNAGNIVLEPGAGLIQISMGATKVGDTQTIKLTVSNTGQGPLTVSSVELAYDSAAAGDDQGTAFELAPVEAPVAIYPRGIQDTFQALPIAVPYRRQSVFTSRVAQLTIRSDDPDQPTVNVVLQESETRPVATVNPKLVDFGLVKKGAVGERVVTVGNTGTETLVIDAFTLTGHPPDFKIQIGDDTYVIDSESALKASLIHPLEIAVDKVIPIKVTYAPTTELAAAGELILYANDDQPDGHHVTLVANQNVPCVEVKPTTVDFGGKFVAQDALLPVEVCNCGQAPLLVSGISLVGESSPDFGLRFADSDCWPSGIDPDVPSQVPLNGCCTFEARFTPDLVNPLDASQNPIPDLGTLRIQTNSFESEIDIPLAGAGIAATCTVAILSVDEGEQVIPQTTLHLRGDQSYPQSPGAVIDTWKWDVVQPQPGGGIFLPGSNHPTPNFVVNAAGLYSFSLDVRDSNGSWSCEPAGYDVIVIPDEAIHVELVWTTASDLDPNDTGEGAGTDLDLHFAHPFATGPDIDGDGAPDPWFDKKFDCFWFNKAPNWGTFNPDVDDDPGLDLDDTDGWGPENLNLNQPEDGQTYRIAVHFWDAYGFGPVEATVRVFIYGELDVEIPNVPLNELDLWYVGTIPWSAGTGKTQVAKEEDGSYVITADYLNPFFLPPN